MRLNGRISRELEQRGDEMANLEVVILAKVMSDPVLTLHQSTCSMS
jgi:hypothetical protein